MDVKIIIIFVFHLLNALNLICFQVSHAKEQMFAVQHSLQNKLAVKNKELFVQALRHAQELRFLHLMQLRAVREAA